MIGLESVMRVRHEMSQAVRSLARAPWYSLTVMSVAALATALLTTVFAVVDGVLFKPLPYERPRELYDVTAGFERLPEFVAPSVSLPDVRAWRAAVPGVRFAAASFGGEIAIADNEALRGAEVDGTFLDVLGVTPLVGGFTSADFGPRTGARAALITHDLWRRRFGGDAQVVGRTLVNSAGDGLRVAGVLPERFVYPHPAGALAPEALVAMPAPVPASDDNARRRWLQVLARVPPGSDPNAIQAQLTAAAAGVAREFPPVPATATGSQTRRITRGPFDVVRLGPLRDRLTADTRAMAGAVLGTAGLLALLACVNLAGLAGGRAIDRRRELTLRRALGASGGTLAQLLAVEQAIVMAGGAALGVLLARGLLRVTMAVTPESVVLLKAPGIDWRAAAFAALAAVVSAAVAVGWSVHTTRQAILRSSLAEGGGTTERAGSIPRAVLIAAQVALALVMTVAGSLLAGSLARVWREDPGFAPDRAARLRISAPATFDLAAIETLLSSVRRSPHVIAAGGLDKPFLEHAFTGSTFDPPATAGDRKDVSQFNVSAGFFRAAGLRAVAGRLPTDEEIDQGRPAIVVSRKVAAAYWAGDLAVGKTLMSKGRPYDVIGIVPDARHLALDLETDGEIYAPLSLQPHLANVIVAFDGDASRGLGAVLAALNASFPQVRVTRAESLASALGVSVQGRRFQTWIFVAFGLAALAIAGVGILGLIAMAASRRTREVGVRMALGATPRRVIRQMLREQMAIVLAGLAAGGLIALWAVRFLEAYVYKLSVYDVRVWTAASLALLAVSLAGVLLPALRASRIDPIRALRVQ